MFKQIAVIINPHATQEHPILAALNRAFRGHDATWDAYITKGPGDEARLTRQAVDDGADLVAVYGGDGTVIAVAHALEGSDVPLAIIPGGMANLLAQELGISLDPGEAIAHFLADDPPLVALDKGLLNGDPFWVRVSAGLPAEMVKGGEAAHQDSEGMLAYVAGALESATRFSPADYNLTLDGETFTAQGVALLVMNTCRMGVRALPLVPGCAVGDGKLDVVLVGAAELPELFSLEPGLIQHWQVQEAQISVQPMQTVTKDDTVVSVEDIHITLVPGALRVVAGAA